MDIQALKATLFFQTFEDGDAKFEEVALIHNFDNNDTQGFLDWIYRWTQNGMGTYIPSDVSPYETNWAIHSVGLGTNKSNKLDTIRPRKKGGCRSTMVGDRIKIYSSDLDKLTETPMMFEETTYEVANCGFDTISIQVKNEKEVHHATFDIY